MLNYFVKTNIGYSHIYAKKVCQDFSAAYHDSERTIITVCDGHGGDVYIRSDKGSKFASEAIIEVFKSLTLDQLKKIDDDKLIKGIKLNVLCTWNNLVENDLKVKPISKRDLLSLQPKYAGVLLKDPIKAYGTTLIGSMLIGNKLITIKLGDGGCFKIKKGEIFEMFEESEDEPVANQTYSMCQDEAFNHIDVSIIDFRDIDGVIICTDGVINPYQSLDNFDKKFVKPIGLKILDGQYEDVDDYIHLLGEKLGIGDDVSLGILLKSNISKRYYKK